MMATPPPAFVALLIAAVLLCSGSSAQRTVPAEVRYKSGFVNTDGRPMGFSSAMLWGIAIADTRAPGYEKAQVEIARVSLTCRVNGKDVVLNDDRGILRGGLYRRHPWFGTDEHDPMPLSHLRNSGVVVVSVGTKPDRVWHLWAGSPRAAIPAGKLGGCAVTVRARVSRGALLQVGFDYWRNPTVGYGSGGNNHEAGASNWYFPSTRWQEARFTDLKP